ncbi:MAG TPA: ferritin-like domain-containing protein [Stellaceae bacterium]|nr:ferritin-like domain-containing protein [Stellaceae bacterium]
MATWTLNDIRWDEFDRRKVDPDLLPIVKAASLVEQNGGDYARYLCNVFDDDPEFQRVARLWGEEEIQHGLALGRWAGLADPSFDHADACARFTAGFRVDLDAHRSVRGTRAGELIARCIVETGTSSYYTALAEASEEPVLRSICQRIAADEFRHYKLFYTHLKRYLAREKIGFWQRLRVAAGRVAESEDDELAYAYHAANEVAAPYDRKRCSRAYARRAYRVYRPHHVERGLAMIFKAVGLKPHGALNRATAQFAWWGMRRRIRELDRRAA